MIFKISFIYKICIIIRSQESQVVGGGGGEWEIGKLPFIHNILVNFSIVELFLIILILINLYELHNIKYIPITY